VKTAGFLFEYIIRHITFEGIIGEWGSSGKCPECHDEVEYGNILII